MLKNGFEADPDVHFAQDVLEHKARYEILVANHEELVAALTDFTPALFRDENRTVYFRQKNLVQRRFFNWLAAAEALSDATKRLIDAPQFTESAGQEYSRVFGSEQAAFFAQLRHLAVHQWLPYLAGFHTASYSQRDGLKASASIVIPGEVIASVLEHRAKNPREKKNKELKAAIRYAKSIYDLNLRKAVSEFESKITSYMPSLRARIEAVSETARNFLEGDENPEPIRKSDTATERINEASA